MKFLMCVGGIEPSADTIRFGGLIARAFQADVSVLYVQPDVPQSVREEVRLAREKLSEWELELPGVRVLRGARDILVNEGFVEPTPAGDFPYRHSLKADVRGAWEVHMYGSHGEHVRLRLREGDIVSEVNKEVESGEYDVVTFGASQKRRILQRIVLFVDCSMLIVKNPQNQPYRILLCTENSESSRRAETFASQLAVALQWPVQLLSVARSRSREHIAMENAERASKLLGRNGVSHSIAVRAGSFEESVMALATEDTLVVMGSSRKSALRTFFFGSKPMKVAGKVPCPILIVK